MPFIGWIIAGGIFRAAVIGTMAAAVGFGSGYIYGRIDASQAAEVAALKQTIENLNSELAAKMLADKIASDAAIADAKAEELAAETATEVEKEITRAPESHSGFTSGFLGSLRKLK